MRRRNEYAAGAGAAAAEARRRLYTPFRNRLRQRPSVPRRKLCGGPRLLARLGVLLVRLLVLLLPRLMPAGRLTASLLEGFDGLHEGAVRAL